MCIVVSFIYSVNQVRSLADSDSVFESACDLDEVYHVCVCLIYNILQNLLDDTMEEGEITSEVIYSCVLIYNVVQVIVEEHIIVIPDVSSVNLNEVDSGCLFVYNNCVGM